jgi:hypothetical protein
MSSEIVINDNELPPEVVKAITQGRKIEAIKLLREATGLGLANAKVLVDRAVRRHEQINPQMSNMTQESNNGRLLGMMLFLLLTFGLYRFFTGA